MPKYYHIHRGTTPSTLEKNFVTGDPLFFSKKDSFWYNVEKSVSKDYGGYFIYEIYISNDKFTKSFNPKSKKIVKITKDNISTYQDLKDKFRGHISFINEMKRRNIIGIDATNVTVEDMTKGFNITPEGYIWEKPDDVIIKRVERKKLKNE